MSDRASRRGLLKWAAGSLFALVGGALAVPAAVLLGTPLRKRTVHGGEEPIAVAELARLVEGVPHRATLVAPLRRDAWTRFVDQPLGSIWLVRKGERVLAFSSTCPHAGCFVDWDAPHQRFACPCHGSVFAVDGACVAGPSPRPMDSLEVAVEKGKVLVRFQRFRQATAEKEPV